jgi:hypothetical protein
VSCLIEPRIRQSTKCGTKGGRSWPPSGGDDKELAQGDIDRIWASAEPGLSHCITEAVADWPLDSGKIEVSYRIEKDGSVKKVRLTAPQLLMRNGLYPCMRGKITALHFPRSGGATVVTFPFALQ